MAISERQQKFRAAYQAQIHPAYSGWLHIGVIYLVGATAIGWCVSRLAQPSWEWLLIVPIFALSNMFEWWIHKYVMHRLVDVWALRAIYDRHTRQHHQYFTDKLMTVDTAREFRIVFFPWRALFTFMGLGVPFALLLAALINPNAGYILMITIVAQYLIYETFHFCCHCHENFWVRNLPLVNTIRRHHRAHHNFGIMMTHNMNLTFPIADWLLGTSDVKRSLLGTLFNGYDESTVPEDLRKVTARWREERPDDIAQMERQIALNSH